MHNFNKFLMSLMICAGLMVPSIAYAKVGDGTALGLSGYDPLLEAMKERAVSRNKDDDDDELSDEDKDTIKRAKENAFGKDYNKAKEHRSKKKERYKERRSKKKERYKERRSKKKERYKERRSKNKERYKERRSKNKNKNKNRYQNGRNNMKSNIKNRSSSRPQTGGGYRSK